MTSQTAPPAARWAELVQDLPATAEALLGVLAGLMQRQEFAAADVGYAAAVAQFPNNIEIASKFARAAEQRGDWAAAAARWHILRQRRPANRAALRGQALAMVRAGQADEAEALLNSVLGPLRGGDLAATDPAVRRLMIDHARLAANRGDLEAARARWQDLLRQLPDDEAVQAGWRDFLTQADPHAAEITAPEAASPGAVLPHAALMRQFEGLGGTCEFGLVQRHFGVEPLGLFRWVSLSAANLIVTLQDGLHGIGEPQFTRMGVASSNEFYTSDTRYGLGMHTFLKNTGQDQDKLFSQLQRRMRFLRDKLLEDLAAGEKIFLYRCRRDTQASDIGLIADAVRTYNPANRLLAVRVVNHGEPAVKLATEGPGLLTATIRDGRKQPHGTGWNVDFETWLEVCTAAAGMA